MPGAIPNQTNQIYICCQGYTPFILLLSKVKNAFSVLALFYIRDKSYFRFWPLKNFTKSIINEHIDRETYCFTPSGKRR